MSPELNWRNFEIYKGELAFWHACNKAPKQQHFNDKADNFEDVTSLIHFALYFIMSNYQQV